MLRGISLRLPVLIATLLAVVVGLSISVKVLHIKSTHQKLTPAATDDRHARLLSEARQLHLQTKALRLDFRFKEAIAIAQRAMLIREEFPGKQSLEYAESLNDLGILYRDTDQYDQADQLHNEALTIQRALLGADSLESAETLNNLCALYEEEKDLTRAQQQCSQALSIGEKFGGAWHPGVATSLAHLGSLYRKQKSYQASETMLNRALEIDERRAPSGSVEVSRDMYFLAELYEDTREFDKALALTSRMIKLDESLHPLDNLAISIDLALHAKLLVADDRYPEAEAAYCRMIDIDKRWYGPRDLAIAGDDQDLADLYELEDKYSEAEKLRLEILALDREKSEDTEATTSDMNDLAELYSYMGRYRDAIKIDQQALKIDSTLTGGDKDDALSVDLYYLGRLYQRVGSYRDADRSLLQVRSIDKKRVTNKTGSPDDVAKDLRALLESYYSQGKLDEATPLINEALQLDEHNPDLNNDGVAEDLVLAAQFTMAKGQYVSAEPLLQRALDFYENKYRGETLYEVEALENLAFAFGRLGNWQQSEALLVRAVKICQGSSGNRPRILANALFYLGKTQRQMSKLHDAELNLTEAVGIANRLVGAGRDLCGKMLTELALVYYYQGRYPEARSTFESAISTFDTANIRSLDLANALQDYSLVLLSFGELEAAQRADDRALGLYTSISQNDLTKLPVLCTLASVSINQGNLAKAEHFYYLALSIGKHQTGPNRAFMRFPMGGLALTHQVRGNYRAAEGFVRRALRIEQQYEGEESVGYAYSLNHLGYLQLLQGDYKSAEGSFSAALALRRRLLGDNHPSVAATLSNLGLTRLREGRKADAIAFESQSGEITEHNLRLLLVLGSEQQKLMYARYLSMNSDYVLSTYGTLRDPDANRLAMSVVLRHKGRVLDVVSNSLRAARDRSNVEDRSALDQLFAARSRLAGLIFGGTDTEPGTSGLLLAQTGDVTTALGRGQKGRRAEAPPMIGMDGIARNTNLQYREAVNQLETEIGRLEGLLSAHTASLVTEFEPVTFENVQGKIPEGYVLIELVRFHVTDLRATWVPGPSRYFGLVLSQMGSAKCIDLGPADAIDKLVYPLRRSLQDRDSTDVKAKGRALSKIVVWPLLSQVGSHSKILISPDGPLNLIPFESLSTKSEKYLIEKFEFTYLSSGRDLLRFDEKTNAREGPVIIANPEFNVSASGSVSEMPEIRPLPFGAVHFSRIRFASLFATEEEANAICETVVCDKVLTGINATKNGLFSVRGPVVLHIATHGFFIRNGDQEAGNTSDKRPALNSSTRPAGNPLLRSGLALTGANASDVTHANGILTSLEASGLDLEGTELVILSACETALGDVRDGEGIYGLRRAFVVAGSKSQLTTLWKVDNDATRDVMISYYRALAAGGGRSEVLRNIKLAAVNDRKHPYYWAGFIPSGYWGQVVGLTLKTASNVAPN